MTYQPENQSFNGIKLQEWFWSEKMRMVSFLMLLLPLDKKK